jgi:hypothetical protein
VNGRWKLGIAGAVVAAILFVCTSAAFVAGASQSPRSAVITVPGSGQVVVPPGRAEGRVYMQERHFGPFGFVFGLLGFLFKLLIFVLIIGIIARLFFWRGRGPWSGPGRFNPQERFEEWHRKQHEAAAEQPAQPAPAAPPSAEQPVQPADGPTQPSARAGQPPADPTEPKPL